MKRALSLLAFVLLFAPAAHATVSVKLIGPFNWSLGVTITLEVLVTANAGETDNTAFGAVLYDSTRLTPLSSSQNALPGSGWITGQLS